MRMIVLKVFMVWLAMVACVYSQDETKQGRNMTNDVSLTKLKSFQLVDGSMHDVVKSLRQHGLRVCFESDKKDDKKHTFKFRDQSVKHILDELTEEFEGYSWKKNERNSIITIRRKGDSVLKWDVPSLRVKKRKFMDVVVQEDVLNLKKHGIVVFYRGFSQPLNALVDVELSNQPVDVCLDMLVSQVPGLCWTISTNAKDKKMMTFHFARNEGEPNP